MLDGTKELGMGIEHTEFPNGVAGNAKRRSDTSFLKVHPAWFPVLDSQSSCKGTQYKTT
jgi:hypothetical protein